MIKEYTKVTMQTYDENMEPKGEAEENIFTSLIAETGKKIKSLDTGVLGTRVDIGTEDSEENYIEVEDPNYIEVIDSIVEEVAAS